MRSLVRALLFVASTSAAFAQGRISSDFEIEEARRQLARGDVASRIAAHLNLGDIYTSRSEMSAARGEYDEALKLATTERTRTRRNGDLTGYARSTSYAGLANAKLGRATAAASLFDEALRYVADSAQTWNRYAAAMLAAGRAADSIPIARNAVTIAERETSSDATVAQLLDLNVYRYTLASALAQTGASRDAAAMLQQVVDSLLSRRFDELRREVAASEKFEILSSTSTDVGAYLSLLSRSRLKLGAIAEQAGDVERARGLYRAVLAQRNDEPTALAALARLGGKADERQNRFEEAFDANPYSLPLIREYEAYLRSGGSAARSTETIGGDVRAVVEALVAGRGTEAEKRATTLLARAPENDVLLFLASRAAAAAGDSARATELAAHIESVALRDDLRAANAQASTPAWLIASDAAIELDETRLEELLRFATMSNLTPAQRAQLDRATFRSRVIFSSVQPGEGDTTILDDASAGNVRLRFSAPTAFRGHFERGVPLELQFKLSGVTADERGPYLLVEPQGVKR